MDDELRRCLKSTSRQNVIESLQLIASSKEQLDYQENVPIAQVSAELFCGWEGDYQLTKNQAWFLEEYSEHELAILHNFDMILEKVAISFSGDLPNIEEFIRTPEWKRLSDAASKALVQLYNCWAENNG